MTAHETHHTGGEHARPRLLIADDDPVVRATLSAHLEREFDIIGLATNATEAVALAELHQPDAALIDVEMPDGGARDAVPRIAVRSPATRMVILSSDESRAVVLELVSAGAVAYLRKGLTGTELCRTLHDALLVTPDWLGA
jgi:DNA-binding NarL/FixJ family response regulator